jgi:hypothetical protein
MNMTLEEKNGSKRFWRTLETVGKRLLRRMWRQQSYEHSRRKDRSKSVETTIIMV